MFFAWNLYERRENMSLLQMSFSGAVMIVVVIVIRAFAINHLPKRTFLILWGIVLLRLMVPFSIPSVFSIYSLIEQDITSHMVVQIPPKQDSPMESIESVSVDNFDVSNMEQNEKTSAVEMQDVKEKTEDIFNSKDYESGNRFEYQTDHSVTDDGKYHLMKTLQKVSAYYQQFKSLCVIIWCAGMVLCIVFFAVSYLRCRFEFQISLPVENAFVQSWLQECSRRYATSFLSVKYAFVQKWIEKHPRRLVSVRQSDRVSTPLTYGILHPVILMPKSTDWENTKQLQYVLMHEYVHICRYDALMKLIVTCALCIHWFNPMVWIMWFLFNQDVEISCDERVVRYMGEVSKSAYALMLIQMEEERSSFVPFCSGLLPKLGKNAMEERITAIMKIKKKSMPAVIGAAVLVSARTLFWYSEILIAS